MIVKLFSLLYLARTEIVNGLGTYLLASLSSYAEANSAEKNKKKQKQSLYVLIAYLV